MSAISIPSQTPSVEAASSAPPRRAPRLHYIDGLRGAAMLAVLLAHSWYFIGAWHVYVPVGHRQLDVARFLSYGHVGVNLFLVLSGFCLYWPFVKIGARGEPTLWGHIKRRCWRILPPYYVALLIFGGIPLVLAMMHGDSGYVHDLLVSLALHATMTHNLSPRHVGGLDGSLWTLALEFQLYLVFPLFVELYRRYPARLVLAGVFLFCTVFRFYTLRGGYVADNSFGYCWAYSIFGRAFEFALGMFIAREITLNHSGGKSLVRRYDLIFIAIVVAIALAQSKHGNFQPLTDAMFGLLFAALLLWTSRPNSLASRALSHRWVVGLGIFSYSVYLIHLPLVQMAGDYARAHQFSNGQLIAFALLLVAPLMVALGYLFHCLFERPFMSLPGAKKPAPAALAREAAG